MFGTQISEWSYNEFSLAVDVAFWKSADISLSNSSRTTKILTVFLVHEHGDDVDVITQTSNMNNIAGDILPFMVVGTWVLNPMQMKVMQKRLEIQIHFHNDKEILETWREE